MAAATVSRSPGDEGLRSVTDAAVEQYCDWGWLTLQSGTRLLLPTDWSIGAVEMQSELCRELTQFLSVRMLAGPVIDLPGKPERSIILTTSADGATPVDLVRLKARGICAHRRGALVPLPPSLLENGPVRWRTPLSGERPPLAPFTAVVAAARAITEPAQETP